MQRKVHPQGRERPFLSPFFVRKSDFKFFSFSSSFNVQVWLSFKFDFLAERRFLTKEWGSYANEGRKLKRAC